MKVTILQLVIEQKNANDMWRKILADDLYFIEKNKTSGDEFYPIQRIIKSTYTSTARKAAI
jgi:hypothetical protein